MTIKEVYELNIPPLYPSSLLLIQIWCDQWSEETYIYLLHVCPLTDKDWTNNSKRTKIKENRMAH